jgi:hypothetical protein
MYISGQIVMAQNKRGQAFQATDSRSREVTLYLALECINGVEGISVVSNGIRKINIQGIIGYGQFFQKSTIRQG